MGKMKYRTHINFKKALRDYREKSKKPFYLLAVRAGVSPTNISYILNDSRLFCLNDPILGQIAELISYSGPLLENNELKQVIG